MKIAVLGWGSLIRDPHGLHIEGGWRTGGPVLPIEFSRISDNGRLTLVIDERNGTNVPTRYALSSLNDLDLAITNLQEREGTPNRDRIGFTDLRHNRSSDRALAKHPIACERIKAWVEPSGFEAVIWTALGPRFREKTGETFSAAAALRYLRSLTGEAAAGAVSYIQDAPEEVSTPVRDRVRLEMAARGASLPLGTQR